MFVSVFYYLSFPVVSAVISVVMAVTMIKPMKLIVPRLVQQCNLDSVQLRQLAAPVNGM